MHQGVIYLLTHDSIGLGEDGPTHQPVEHLAACRAIPGLNVLRPADANEVAWCYRVALQQDKNPSAMVLSRQNLPTIDRNGRGPAAGTARGGYTVVDCAAEPQVILIGTGSELMLCIEAAEKLTDEGIAVRVVSMPCFELFDQQDADYRNSILPANVHARVGVEAGIRMGWDRYLGTDGHFVGMDSFGASAPAEALYEHFGITVENIVKSAKAQLA